jgi:hypothetical protein
MGQQPIRRRLRLIINATVSWENVIMALHRIQAIAATLVVVGTCLFPLQPASATAYCQLKPTKDGFVALRSGPGASSKLVGRMKAQDEVLLGDGRKGDWQEVTWWRGDDRLVKGQDKVAGRGWVHAKLIAEECG